MTRIRKEPNRYWSKEDKLKLINGLGLGYSQRNLTNMRPFYNVSQKWRHCLQIKLESLL